MGLRGCDGLIDYDAKLLLLCGSSGALRNCTLFPAEASRVQGLPLVSPPTSGRAWNGLEAELFLEDSERAFDLPEISKMLTGNAPVGSNSSSDDVDVLVGAVVVLDHGVTVPPHFSSHICRRQEPTLRCEMLAWEQGDREMSDGFGDPRPECGDGPKFGSQFCC